MTLEPGDIVLLPFPHTDLKRSKRRPALVLSSRTYNEGPDIVVCAVTSNLKNAAYSVTLLPTEMAEGKLILPSRVKVGKLASVDQRLVIRRVGRIKPAVMRQVWKEFHSLFPG